MFSILPFSQALLVTENAHNTCKKSNSGPLGGWADQNPWLLFNNFAELMRKINKWFNTYREKLEWLTSVPKIFITDFMLSSNAELVILLVCSLFQGTLIWMLSLVFLDHVHSVGTVSGRFLLVCVPVQLEMAFLGKQVCDQNIPVTQ